jgi:hypothetical protein
VKKALDPAGQVQLVKNAMQTHSAANFSSFCTIILGFFVLAGNRSIAALTLGMTRQALNKRLRKEKE